MHARGLKLGIYAGNLHSPQSDYLFFYLVNASLLLIFLRIIIADYGTKTCAGYPGSIKHIKKDAQVTIPSYITCQFTFSSLICEQVPWRKTARNDRNYFWSRMTNDGVIAAWLADFSPGVGGGGGENGLPTYPFFSPLRFAAPATQATF